MRRTRLSLQYCVKLMTNEVNPAYSAVFQSDILAPYEATQHNIKSLGLRIERHLDEVGFHPHVIAPYMVMKPPPWKLIVPTVYVIYVNTRRVKLIKFYIVYIILICWIPLRIIHIYLQMDLKMAKKELRLLSVYHFRSQDVYLTRRQFLPLS